MAIVRPADILLPDVENIEKWSVIACDQFTSDPDYWAETERIAGEAPSALRLILPEVCLGTEKAAEISRAVPGKMAEYCSDGTFRELKDAYIYVERELSDGTIRHGIVAAIDLDAYEFAPEADALVKATERTVKERLVKRLDLRRNASVELPHVLVFYDDPGNSIMSEITANKDALPLQYSFDLMQGGGHIEGRLIQGKAAERLTARFEGLEKTAKDSARPEEGEYAVMLAVGDGNHSLATAKAGRDEMKKELPPEERDSTAARYALVELVNVYDGGINIEPIHRAVKDTDNRDFVRFIGEYFKRFSGDGEPMEVTAGTGESERVIPVFGLGAGELVAEADRAIGEYIEDHGGVEDYIHDKASAEAVGSAENAAFLLLPQVPRDEIFKTVRKHRILPKKCFSIGHAREKRYYLEARKIK